MTADREETSGRTVGDPAAARAAVAEHPFAATIGGQGLGGAGRARWSVTDPTTESELTQVELAGPADLDRAVEVAAAAARPWGRAPWTRRAAALRELADRVEDHAHELGHLDTFEAGLPVTTAVKDVHDAARSLRYFAGLGGEVTGRAHPWAPGQPSMRTTREPYGVVGKIVPFNHPVKFAAVKSAAALVAGNAVVVKPSEHSLLSALRLAELADGVLPSGVFTVLPGEGDLGAAIAAHPGIPRLSFTGSVATGQQVLRAAAEEIKHVTAELGGKNPMLILPDADPVETARAAVASLDLYRSPGQACWSTSRVLVHDDLREPFLKELMRQIDALVVGDPADPEVDFGPVAFARHHGHVRELIASGKAQGATMARGEERALPEAGYFVAPTVFVDVDPSMRIAREEIFGPVLAVLGWRDLREAVRIANDVPYGLTASVWTRDDGLGQAVARELEAGLVWVNTPSARAVGLPFGGYKRSGVGREGNLDEVASYTREKAILTGYGVREDVLGP